MYKKYLCYRDTANTENIGVLWATRDEMGSISKRGKEIWIGRIEE
jgi:hypothetical protein